MSILVTGGTGYIGSHTVIELLKENKEIIILDNLCNSSIDVLEKIKQITGKTCKFYKVDIREEKALEEIFTENEIDSVIHFAGLKGVGESVEIPLEYYENNVYGNPGTPKYTEEMGRGKASSPYGATKAIIEEMLENLYESDKEWIISLLRYFNPIGAHESGLIGDNPNGIPNNLMPYIQKVAIGELKELSVFGNDYDTKDGTGVRDYIHVVDLAIGHIKALEKLTESGVYIHNLGTGCGYSVLEIINTFEKVNNIKIKYKIAPRRAGDLAIYYADPNKAEKELEWKAERGIEEMCRDSWNFIKKL